SMPDHERRSCTLLIRQSQKLHGKLAHHVAVEGDKVRDPMAVKNREQQQWIFRRLSERFSLFEEETRPVHGGSGFWRRVAADMKKWGYEFHLKLNLQATHVGRAWQGRDHVECAFELFLGFDQSRTLRRPLSSFPP